MRVTARWGIMRYVHFADQIKCAWDLVNTAKALAAARPSARIAEESRTSCTRMKWGSFLGRRETIFLSSIYCYEKRGILWLIYKL